MKSKVKKVDNFMPPQVFSFLRIIIEDLVKKMEEIQSNASMEASICTSICLLVMPETP